MARPVPSMEELEDVRRQAGLDALGVAPADPMERARRIIERRKQAGLHGGMAFTYGKPERSTDPRRILPEARALVVAARSYLRVTPSRPLGPVGRVARYAWRDHYRDLGVGLELVAERLRSDGWNAVAVADDNRLVDRAAAHLAGLGWFGKNTNILLPDAGSWFILGAVVTDAPLEIADTLVPDGCGSCTRCIPACPTGALDEPGVLDARRCLAWLVQAPGSFPREYREALGDRLYGCDDCQEACPPNRRAERRQPPPDARLDDEAWVDLLSLLACDDEQLTERFGRWYIPRRQPYYLRRNALVVLGNIGDGRDAPTVAALEQCLRHDEAVVRAHAVWAARRLGRADLCADLIDDPDGDVRAELDAPVRVRATASSGK